MFINDFHGLITCNKGVYIKLKYSIRICFNCLMFSFKNQLINLSPPSKMMF